MKKFLKTNWKYLVNLALSLWVTIAIIIEFIQINYDWLINDIYPENEYQRLYSGAIGIIAIATGTMALKVIKRLIKNNKKENKE